METFIEISIGEGIGEQTVGKEKTVSTEVMQAY